MAGFSPKQRDWFIYRDKCRCSMYTFNKKEGVWSRCTEEKNLHAHHIRPRGFMSHHFTRDDKYLNGPENGIILCAKHHIAKGAMPEELLYCVHPDMNAAIERYRRGDLHAYTDLFMVRHQMNLSGIPYWNSCWDAFFLTLARKRNAVVIPKLPYPFRGERTPPVPKENLPF